MNRRKLRTSAGNRALKIEIKKISQPPFKLWKSGNSNAVGIPFMFFNLHDVNIDIYSCME